MEKKTIETKNAPAAIGPYEQGIKINSFIFTSGQIPINPVDNKMINGTIEEETRQVLNNISAVLEAGGANLDNVLKVTVYLKDMSDFAKMNEVYSSFFDKCKPARTCVEVSELPKGARVEMDAVAFVV